MAQEELRSISIVQLAERLKKQKGDSLKAVLAELQKLHCGRSRGKTGPREISWKDISLKHLTEDQLRRLINSSDGKENEVEISVGPLGLWGRENIRGSDTVYKKPPWRRK